MNSGGQLAEQLVQLRHLLVIRLLEQPERHDHTLVVLLVFGRGAALGSHRARRAGSRC